MNSIITIGGTVGAGATVVFASRRINEPKEIHHLSAFANTNITVKDVTFEIYISLDPDTVNTSPVSGTPLLHPSSNPANIIVNGTWFGYEVNTVVPFRGWYVKIKVANGTAGAVDVRAAFHLKEIDVPMA